jgi:Predicted membrane protein
LVCDILKGVISILLALLIGKIAKEANNSILVQIAGILVIIGHTFPIFFKFKGGKGVATAVGVLLTTNWTNRINLFNIWISINSIN